MTIRSIAWLLMVDGAGARGTLAASGKTPAEVARQTAQYYTSSAVDDQW
ncbi:hypothetical protein [Sphingomonas sp. Leaf42]|nr:hypothetical protein [Sphingomonas sp. Leaf42]